MPEVPARIAADCGTDPISYMAERPWLSVFAVSDGDVYMTYSTTARGLEVVMTYYGILDRAAQRETRETRPTRAGCAATMSLSTTAGRHVSTNPAPGGFELFGLDDGESQGARVASGWGVGGREEGEGGVHDGGAVAGGGGCHIWGWSETAVTVGVRRAWVMRGEVGEGDSARELVDQQRPVGKTESGRVDPRRRRRRSGRWRLPMRSSRGLRRGCW